MYNIVKASDEEKQILFQNTAEKMNLHPAIIEKDFWVLIAFLQSIPLQKI